MLSARPYTRILRPLTTAPQTCRACQNRAFSRSRALRADDPIPKPAPPSAAERFKMPGKETKDGEFMPEPLGRPIGFNRPPVPGENSCVDMRSLRQRRDDFVDRDKHLQRRKALTKALARPYFKDWSNMRFHKGKMFLANPRIFRPDAALWFPNFQAPTLASSEPKDTTNVFFGKVSVVAIYSSDWALQQVNSFLGAEQNPELHKVLEANPKLAQKVEINVEENFLRRWILKMFFGKLKAERKEADWGRYFLFSQELSEEMKETIGVLNSKVGYVYLVDQDCRIRWAATADAVGEEKEYLVSGLKKLLDQKQGSKKTAPRTTSSVEKELEAQAVSAGAS